MRNYSCNGFGKLKKIVIGSTWKEKQNMRNQCGTGMSFECGSNLCKFKGEILRESKHLHTVAKIYSAVDVAEEMLVMNKDQTDL